MQPIEARAAAIIHAYEDRNRRRTLDTSQSHQGREIQIEGTAYLNFSSNDYLGLSAHPDVCAAAQNATKHYGVGSGGSALLTGRSNVHVELEQKLARFLNRDSALLFSSGYLANIGVITALVERHDEVFHDRLNHASLIDAIILSRCRHTRYPHRDLATLKRQLDDSGARNRWIVSDTVFSMDGDIAPLAAMAEIAHTHNATLIGDDAHGFGVLGNGRGAAAEFGLSASDLPVQIITFGKALGTAGAAVVGSRALIDALVQKSRTFIYDTAPPPMLAAATIVALELIAGKPEIRDRLISNIDYFRELGNELPLQPSRTPIQPVLIGSDSRAVAIAENLRGCGIYVRAIRPPTVPAGTARLRVCISAAHNRDDIQRLAMALRSAFLDSPR